MAADALKFVLAGHVDHGKSTLIGRLLYDTGSLPEGRIEEIRRFCDGLGKELELGYVVDSLEEERDQGITIDTAQIFFKTKARDYVVIDAPGHVEFLRNMITGASQADAGVLIVDVREGVKEQTKRHARLLSLLGIGRLIVVINKMDLVDYDRGRFERVKEDALSFFSRLGVEPACVIPVSAKHGDLVVKGGDRMAWYGGPALVEALDALAAREDTATGPLRFVVQDVYNFDRRIVVGRVESGLLRSGAGIVVHPSGGRTRVKCLEEYGRHAESAGTGKSIGFVTEDKLFIDRGDVVSGDTDPPLVARRVRANVFWMDGEAYKKGRPLLFRCGTQEVPCTIEEVGTVVDSSTLEAAGGAPGEIRSREIAEVTIRMDRPVAVDTFSHVKELGRFVLEDENAVAGGIVTGVKP